MKTLEEVFTANLKKFRGDRTQAEIAEAAGLPLRSYQRAEYGDLPQGPNRAAIARALGVPETHLFVDWDEFIPRAQAESGAFWPEILAALTAVDPAKMPLVLNALRAWSGKAPAADLLGHQGADLKDLGRRKK